MVFSILDYLLSLQRYSSFCSKIDNITNCTHTYKLNRQDTETLVCESETKTKTCKTSHQNKCNINKTSSSQRLSRFWDRMKSLWVPRFWMYHSSPLIEAFQGQQQQLLRIPTGWRQASWLFTSAAEKLDPGALTICTNHPGGNCRCKY